MRDCYDVKFIGWYAGKQVDERVVKVAPMLGNLQFHAIVAALGLFFFESPKLFTKVTVHMTFGDYTSDALFTMEMTEDGKSVMYTVERGQYAHGIAGTFIAIGVPHLS